MCVVIYYYDVVFEKKKKVLTCICVTVVISVCEWETVETGHILVW